MNLNFSPSFIEIYDKALSSNDCNMLISQFEKHPNKLKGKIYKNGVRTVDKDIKDSYEIDDPSFSESTVMTSIISTSLDKIHCHRETKKSSVQRLLADRIFAISENEQELLLAIESGSVQVLRDEWLIDADDRWIWRFWRD